MSFWNRVAEKEVVPAGCTEDTFFTGWATSFMAFNSQGGWALGPDNSNPRIEKGSIPSAAVWVNVTVNDNGQEFKTKMVAGQFAHEVQANGMGLRPRSDWLIGLLDA